MANGTIFALSSGGLPSGVAVVRVSGPACASIWVAMIGRPMVARRALLATIRDPQSRQVLDRGLVLYFAAPASSTGEDVIEMHLHGGRAVVASVLATLGRFEATRPAEAGEFTRRAFVNGKIDLTEAEGLADLIAAETRTQQRQAINGAGGALRAKAGEWRAALMRATALIEATIDFSDEGEIGDELMAEGLAAIATLRCEIENELTRTAVAERIREGFRVALMGPPNAGKSSLLNALAGREVAIVSPHPGTTRDVLTVALDLDGFAVVISDTAGLRPPGDEIEAEGVRRAHAAGEAADLIVWLSEDDTAVDPTLSFEAVEVLAVRSKDDSGTRDGLSVSVRRSDGLEALIVELRGRAATGVGGEPALVSHHRQAGCLAEVVRYLGAAAVAAPAGAEFVAEELRGAALALGRLTGAVGVEDVLGEIFSVFCIGK